MSNLDNRLRNDFVMDPTHPMLAKVRAALISRTENAQLRRFFATSMTYLSPRVLTMCFGRPDHGSGDDFTASLPSERQLLDQPDLQESAMELLASVREETLPETFHVLLDYRGLRRLDWISVNHTIESLQAHSITAWAVVSKALSEKPSIPALRQVLDSPTDVHSEVFDALDHNTSHRRELSFRSTLTLQLLEATLGPLHEHDAPTPALIAVDFTQIHSANFAALYFFRLSLEVLYRTHGTVTVIAAPKSSRRSAQEMRQRLEEFPTAAFDNRPIANRSNTTLLTNEIIMSAEPKQRSHIRRYVDPFLTYLAGQFSRLSEHKQYRYEQTHSSRVPHFSRLPVRHFIKLIVFELVENAELYSEGPVRVSLSASGGILTACIGDLGIGLRSGILQNYDLAHKLMDNESVVNTVFNLPDFSNTRKRDDEFEDAGAGHGLAECLQNVFRCHGRLLLRTGHTMAGFMNPITRATKPSTITRSSFFLPGTQYLILIPLNSHGDRQIPARFGQLMDMH